MRRTRDGTWVIYHDEHVGEPRHSVRTLHYEQLCEAVGYTVPQAPAVMEILAKRVIGHLDLKEAAGEHTILGTAIDIFGPTGFVATTESPASIRRIKSYAPTVRTALSTGNPKLARSRRVRPALRNHRRFDVKWIADSGADWVALNHRLATDKVLKLCRRNNVGVMLWTVNEPDLIARHLADTRIDVLITDRPQYAAKIRAEMALAAPLPSPHDHSSGARSAGGVRSANTGPEMPSSEIGVGSP